MGIKLIVEVMDHAPTTLTHREKLLLVVLAEDARDSTRRTWNSIERPEILRRAKVSRSQLYEVVKSLIAKDALKREAAGQKNGTAKYVILPLAPQCPGIPDTDESQCPGSWDAEPESQCPETPDTEAAQCPGNRDVSVPETGTPTPQPPHTHPPSPDPRASPTDPHGREGGEDAPLENAYQTLATITARHPQLAVGEKELRDLAPLAAPWLERAPAERLEHALTAGLPRDIGNPTGILRRRLLDKLPPPAAAPTLEPHCRDPRCDPITHMTTLPDGDIDFCPVCHPTGRARARRQAQGRTP